MPHVEPPTWQIVWELLRSLQFVPSCWTPNLANCSIGVEKCWSLGPHVEPLTQQSVWEVLGNVVVGVPCSTPDRSKSCERCRECCCLWAHAERAHSKKRGPCLSPCRPQDAASNGRRGVNIYILPSIPRILIQALRSDDMCAQARYNSSWHGKTLSKHHIVVKPCVLTHTAYDLCCSAGLGHLQVMSRNAPQSGADSNATATSRLAPPPLLPVHPPPLPMPPNGCPHWECLCAIARHRPDWNPCVAGWATWRGEGSSLGSDQAVQSQRAGLFQFSGRGILEIECGPSLIIDS